MYVIQHTVRFLTCTASWLSVVVTNVWRCDPKDCRVEQLSWYNCHLTRMGPSNRLRTFLSKHYTFLPRPKQLLISVWWRCIHTGRPQAQILPVNHLVIPCSMLDRINLCTSVHVHISCMNAHVGAPSLEPCKLEHTRSYSQENQYIISSELTVWHIHRDIQTHRDRITWALYIAWNNL